MEPLPESANPGWPFPFVPQDWEHTPAAVQAYVHNLPLVSVVMPIKNEAKYLAVALGQLNAQSYPHERLEILIVDGGSTDETLELVQKLMAQDSRVRLFGGKDVNCPLAMNIGIEQARGEFIAKVDGHGYVNEDFTQN